MNTYYKNAKSRIRVFATLLAFLFTAGTVNAQTYFDMSTGNYSQTFTAWSGYATNWNGLAALSTGTIPSATKTTVATTTLATISSGTAIGYDVASSTKLVFLTTGTSDNTSSVGCDLNLNFTGRIADSLLFDAGTIVNGSGNRVSTLRVYYSLDGTSWTEITGTNLPYVSTNGTASTTPIAIGLPSALSNQATVKLRFYCHNGTGGSTGSRPKISLDNLIVKSSVASSAPSTQVTAINFTGTTFISTDVNWTNGDGNGRIVKANTVNSFTNPTAGSLPSANATYSSGEQVVYSGTSNTVTVGGLVAGQTYYFRAYEYNATGYVYNTSTTTGNPSSLTINYPTPTLTTISPSSIFAGGSTFTLTATGTDFYPSSVINWNGTPLTTTYVNSTTLSASVSAGNISTAGTASVTVVNTTPGGGTSNSQSFTINLNTSPSIAVSSAFTSFTSETSVASASQSYTVSGSNLTDDISIAVSSPYQISTDNSNWSSSVTLTQSGGAVPSTTIYVHLLSATSGIFSGTLSHSTTGTTNVDVNISGSAIETSPSTQSAITLSSASASSLSFSLNGGNGAKNFSCFNISSYLCAN